MDMCAWVDGLVGRSDQHVALSRILSVFVYAACLRVNGRVDERGVHVFQHSNSQKYAEIQTQSLLSISGEISRREHN